MNTLTSDSDLAAGRFAFLLSLTEFAGPLSLSLSWAEDGGGHVDQLSPMKAEAPEDSASIDLK